MTCYIKPIPFKPPRLLGLSERLLASHYENNYGGAVRRLNAIEDTLTNLPFDSAPGFEINGLKREALIASNSMVLHEVYFESLGGQDGLGSVAVDPPGPLATAIAHDFGSLSAWREQFTAMGKALGGGSGWVILSWSARKGRLENQWAADHTHALADGVPILALDMYEHAYHLDFGADAAGYVDAYMQNLHWDRPAQRLAVARGRAAHTGIDAAAESATPASRPEVTPEALRDMLNSGEKPLLLDVCLKDDMASRYDKLPCAQYSQAETMDQWMAALPKDQQIVVYCMYGYQVSGNAMTALREQGFDAKVLAGGIASWRAIGGPTEALPR